MDDEYPWHRLAFRYSVQSETGYGAPIVSEQDPSLFGCPLKNRPIVGLPQPYVLDACVAWTRRRTSMASASQRRMYSSICSR